MDIYSQELLDIYKNPMNKGRLQNLSSISVIENNPFCGDTITLDLRIEDNIIMDAKFDGEACAVSVISSSLLTDDIIGKSLEDAKAVTKDDLLNMIGINLTTSRVKCATLVLSALHRALNEYETNRKS